MRSRAKVRELQSEKKEGFGPVRTLVLGGKHEQKEKKAMACVGSSAVLPHLRTLFNAGVTGGLTDGQLLERFVASDLASAGPAFEALVARHGPMVLGVCRRILRNPQDAEDAFQATFLVLVRRATTLQVEDSLGGWLHEVSRRIAMQARSCGARLAAREVLVPRMESVEAPAFDPDRGELLSIIDEEIARLPAKYRAAVVLCDLEGLSHPVVARQLRCPVGTIESRLSRGRARLRIRLTRRGLAPWVPAVAVGLPTGLAPVSVPAKLAGGVVRTAVRTVAGHGLAEVVPASVRALATGLLKTMIVTRIQVALVTLTLLALGALGTTLAEPLIARDLPQSFRPAARGKARPARAQPDLLLTGRTAYDPNKLVKIRPRFDTLVEKVRVELGQKVKKGDALVDLSSEKLAAAKNDFQTAYVQWQHDVKLVETREKLARTYAISRQVLVDAQNDEKKSRLTYTTAREKLIVFGVPEEQIDPLIKNPDDLRKRDPIHNATDKAKLTRLSPIDGSVMQRDVVPGNLYDHNDVLMVIAPFDHLLVWAKLPKQDAFSVKVGQECEVLLPSLGQIVWTKVDYVSDPTDPVDGSVRIRMTIPNPAGRLKADMLVRVGLRPLASAQQLPNNS
jgi:RNA polymerase sigma factor (sigma-70 family)